MQPQTWIDAALGMPWIAWSVGGGLIALGLVLLWLFLISDRSRGRRRCPKCWYDLRGTPGLRCSECGYEARRERALFRTRRRWRRALAALPLLLIGIGVSLAPKVRRDGWLSILPTAALLRLVPRNGFVWPGAFGPIEMELNRRFLAASFGANDWHNVVTEKAIRYRKKWPAGSEVVLDVGLPDWLIGARVSFGRGVRIVYRGGFWHRVAVPGVAMGDQVLVDLRVSPPQRVNPQSTVAKTLPPVFLQEGSLWNGPAALPITIVPSIDQAMTNLSGPEIDREIRELLQVQLSEESSGCSFNRPTIACVLDRTSARHVQDLAIGFRVSLRGPNRTILVEFDSRGEDGGRILGFNSATGLADSDFSTEEFTDKSRWRVELKGDPWLALRDWERGSYWEGMIELSDRNLWVQGIDDESDRLGVN